MKTKTNGLAAILAQSPAVAAAFGRWPGFVLMVTAVLGFVALAIATLFFATTAAQVLSGKALSVNKVGLSLKTAQEHFRAATRS